MAQFKSFDPNVEVNGEVVTSILEGMGEYKEIGKKLLKNHGIVGIEKGAWYPLQSLLDTFKDISEKLGEPTLFLIGSKIPEVAIFPPNIESFEQGMPLIDQAYHMNHRNGDIGYYKFDTMEGKQAKMTCENPYPCEFDRGLISGFAKIFTPNGIGEEGVTVMIDDSVKPRREGGDITVYEIVW